MTTRRTIHGAALAALRVAYGITQSDLAAVMGISGAYLNNIEAGRKPGTMKLARAASAHIGVDLAAITATTARSTDAEAA
ncbi:helix-turn-helix transcriptional regulator [Nocardiopsis sp. ARC36]